MNRAYPATSPEPAARPVYLLAAYAITLPSVLIADFAAPSSDLIAALKLACTAAFARSRPIPVEVAVQLRPAGPQDLPTIHSIYAHHVLHGLAPFEEEPGVEELARRFREVTRQCLPYLVAEYGYEVAGYGYCAPYRARSGYRYSLEDSIYIRRSSGAVRRSPTATSSPVIGDSGNAASIGVHTACGFLRVGTLRLVGFKFGRWVDSVHMQRSLGPGDGTRP